MNTNPLNSSVDPIRTTFASRPLVRAIFLAVAMATMAATASGCWVGVGRTHEHRGYRHEHERRW
jgi:hypothetical protein